MFFFFSSEYVPTDANVNPVGNPVTFATLPTLGRAAHLTAVALAKEVVAADAGRGALVAAARRKSIVFS